jgi:hypothetical protein
MGLHASQDAKMHTESESCLLETAVSNAVTSPCNETREFTPEKEKERVDSKTSSNEADALLNITRQSYK